MRLYQGGPMRDCPLFNFQLFEDGACHLRDLEHEVISPHEIDIDEKLVEVEYELRDGHIFYTSVILTPKFSIEAALKRDFAAIATCDAISFLPDFSLSSGSMREFHVARWLGIPAYIHAPRPMGKRLGGYFKEMNFDFLLEL
jgi:hypothetical protein